MTPSLSRAEVATRLACADVQGSSLPLDKDRAVWAAQVVATADAIAFALTSPVAPKSEAAKYEPRVGDVITFQGSTCRAEYVVTAASGGIRVDCVHLATGDRTWLSNIAEPFNGHLVYLRPATPAERAAAGLPSPEATRPTWVKVTREIPSWSGGDRIEAGTVLPVNQWGGDYAYVAHRGGGTFMLRPNEWEPATPPAPVEPAKPGTVENMAAHLAWCAWCGTDGRSELPYDAFRAGYLAALAARGAP